MPQVDYVVWCFCVRVGVGVWGGGWGVGGGGAYGLDRDHLDNAIVKGNNLTLYSFAKPAILSQSL